MSFRKLATLQELEQVRKKPVEIDGIPALLVLSPTGVLAVQRYCPHRGAPLADGYLVEEVLVCSWHRSVFSLDSGRPVAGPSRCGLRMWQTKIDNGDVLVASEPYPSSSDGRSFDVAFPGHVDGVKGV